MSGWGTRCTGRRVGNEATNLQCRAAVIDRVGWPKLALELGMLCSSAYVGGFIGVLAAHVACSAQVAA